MTILGIPKEDEPLMLKLTQELFGGTDHDIARSFEPMEIMNVVGDFENYFNELTIDRRKKPTDDLASLIANSKIDGESPPNSRPTATMIVATAGRDTTSSSVSGGLLALMENPAEMEKLKE